MALGYALDQQGWAFLSVDMAKKAILSGRVFLLRMELLSTKVVSLGRFQWGLMETKNVTPVYEWVSL